MLPSADDKMKTILAFFQFFGILCTLDNQPVFLMAVRGFSTTLLKADHEPDRLDHEIQQRTFTATSADSVDLTILSS